MTGQQHAILDDRAEAAGEDDLFDIFAKFHHVFGGIGMVDANHVLLDDRPFIEVRRHEVASGTDQLDATTMGLVIRFGTGE